MLYKLGSKGEVVEEIQSLLGIKNPDGLFGPNTQAVVINFQKTNGLVPDGIVGKETIAMLRSGKGISLSDVIPKDVYMYLEEAFEVFQINTPKRKAMFLAQCAHESGDFRVTEENLNYSREGLLSVFPKYFNENNVDDYARQPEKIANLVYGNRMGNRDEYSGDGYRYRGRGIIQLTGKVNYMLYGNVSDPDSLKNMPEALYSAARFWRDHNLNKFADEGDVKGCTRVINGGYNGLEDRINKYNKFIKIV